MTPTRRQTSVADQPSPVEPNPHHRIEIYDTTLRDGTQGEGVSLSLVDKLKIAEHLDALGVDFIEGGYPLSNPKDAAFFARARTLNLQCARLCAFGMTRRKGLAPSDDPGMAALVAAAAPVITIVGKTWDLHVDEVLGVSRQENLDMIRQSLAYCLAAMPVSRDGPATEVFYDAEHFFDGYRANPDYARQTLLAALEGGATRLILCDTNGGSLPGQIARTVAEVLEFLAGRSGLKASVDRLLGIHTHNDSGLAVANALAAIEAGAVQVQGTINGIGERCGNVDLTTVIANLQLKLNCQCLRPGALATLTNTSRFVYEMANMNLNATQPFVGSAAFAHKGGMHVHAVQRLAGSYEHVAPESVGNTRRVLISELSGASNVTALLGRKFNIAQDRALQKKVLNRLCELENQGYQFEAAAASFELLVRDVLGERPSFWNLDHYRLVILKPESQPPVTEATVKLKVRGQPRHEVAEGDGPVNALDGALRKCLSDVYPQLSQVHLRDYKVRVVNATAESAAKVRVIVDFAVVNPETPEGSANSDQIGPASHFSTIGVSENIVDASWQALTDAFTYYLLETHAATA